MLDDQTHEQWQKYGHSVGKLPPEIRERHERIHNEAIERARAQGWAPPMEDE